jgi:hypothetical protein
MRIDKIIICVVLFLFLADELIGRRGPYPVEPEVRACSGKFTTTEYVVKQFSDRGMDPRTRLRGGEYNRTKVRNFLSNEDTGKHRTSVRACFELAPGFFIFCAKSGFI